MGLQRKGISHAYGMEDDKNLTSKLDCKEIKINNIKERFAIQSPGNFFFSSLEREPRELGNFKWFIAGIWDWLVEVGTLKGLRHGCVF